VSTAEAPDEGRRDFLYIATGAVGAVGAASLAIPLIDQMNPTADVLALASIEVDLAPIEEGQSITVTWRGNPVIIRHRTAKEIEEASATSLDDLPDNLARNENLPENTPATDENRVVDGKLAVSGPDGRLHAPGLRAHRQRRRIRWLVLPLPRLALRHRRPHPQGSGSHQSSGASV
jgi:hypothetical protein